MSDIATDDTAADDTATDDTDLLFRDEADDPDEMPTRASRRVVTAWTIVFAALLLAGAGFVTGIQMEKRNAPAATGLPPGLAAFANGRANGVFNGGGAARIPGAPGATGAQAAPTGGTTGTVKLVDGANVYVTTSDGSIVKITTSPTSKVSKTTPGAVSDLKAGDTVVVQGATSADGSVAATAITQTGSAP